VANNHDIMDLTLHGGGQGFDSPRLHYINVQICRVKRGECKRGQALPGPFLTPV